MSNKDQLIKRVQAFNEATGSENTDAILILCGGKLDLDYDSVDVVSFVLDAQKGTALLL